jgi:release factor glutamine methyltransferase
MEVYQPAEDSYFLSDFLRDYLDKKEISSYLDMGTGSAILSKTALEFLSKDQILAMDINPLAVREAKTQGVNAIESDLFDRVKGKFDLITFNAPYLPRDPREPKDSQVATTGGKRGDEISVKFLSQAKKHLSKEGRIFLLVSSLTPMDKIAQFKPKIVARKKLFMEELRILEFRI